MNKYKVRVNKINLTNNYYEIISDDDLHFIAPVRKGSVNIKIYNELKQEVNLGSILEDNLIIIYGNDINGQKQQSDIMKLYNYLVGNNNFESKEEKNNIVIHKIYVKNLYIFSSETSEEIEDFEE